MKWFLLFLLMFIASDICLLYLVAKTYGIEGFLIVAVVPWLIRKPLVEWARKRAEEKDRNDMERLGSTMTLGIASALLFLPGILVRLAGFALLSHKVRRKLAASIGRKAFTVISANPESVMHGPRSVVFQQMYGNPRGWRVDPMNAETLKRAEGREVDPDEGPSSSALPDNSGARPQS